MGKPKEKHFKKSFKKWLIYSVSGQVTLAGGIATLIMALVFYFTAQSLLLIIAFYPIGIGAGAILTESLLLDRLDITEEEEYYTLDCMDWPNY